ncbi:MAG: ribose 5-phosphate isomerase B [Candidatus Eisenbacteria bacterium]|nr:ribose 5-phosphate isomerase B [Candidatus Eisenbacteria bacterium]
MKIALASDHAGYALKEAVKRHLEGRADEATDFGASCEEPCDYPDFGEAAARAVAAGEAERGVLVCGSGQGMCMVANKVAGVRAALAWNAEIARLSRLHNDANVLCLPARFVSERDALAIVDEWLATAFEGGRHARRVEKLMRTEEVERWQD